MKPIRPSNSEAVLKAFSTTKRVGPIQRLSNIFTHPVLTDGESKALLNEINSSFRKNLDQARHPNDVRPPPSIQNRYANKADNHVSRVVTEISEQSGKQDDLRTLLDSKILIDPSPIAVFERHYSERTATPHLAIECLQRYIALELHQRGRGGRHNGGFMLWQLINTDPNFAHDKMPVSKSLKSWLTAALLLSNHAGVPLKWARRLLEGEDYDRATNQFEAIWKSYERIYPEIPNAGIQLFLHILKFRDPDYRAWPSRFSHSTPVIYHMRPQDLISLSDALQNVMHKSALETIGKLLYRRADNDGKRLLAEARQLWVQEASSLNAEIELVHDGNPELVIKHLRSIGGHNHLEGFNPKWTINTLVGVGLLATMKLGRDSSITAQEIKDILAERIYQSSILKLSVMKPAIMAWVDQNMKGILADDGDRWARVRGFLEQHLDNLSREIAKRETKSATPSTELVR
ncbi:hypothetical protein H072_6006 [Dactylellina haptotyla CBS 200.50]|uniref:Uncharacterized protein n=1 Tax=Dactylellina haptotyla (strain CBS 200.50) TaxID=1284197 RepID=S8AGD1_DACHA|nr:hypothetical protein H072_6006 [Dactylellina haptotyla CBS 200.50]